MNDKPKFSNNKKNKAEAVINSPIEDIGFIPPIHYQVYLYEEQNFSPAFTRIILYKFFQNISEERIEEIFVKLKEGKEALCGVFTREVAENKISEIISFIQENNKNSLKCFMRKEQNYAGKKS